MTRWSSDLGDDSSRSWWRKIIIVMVVGCSWSSVGSCESGKAKAAAISTHIGYNDTVVVANKNLELPWELDWKQRQIINDLSFTIIISDMHWSTKMLSLTASQSAVFLPAAPLSLCCLLFPISLDPLSDGHDISTTNERTNERSSCFCQRRKPLSLALGWIAGTSSKAALSAPENSFQR